MARNAEVATFLLDVSPSMHSHFQDALEFVKEQFVQKLLFNPKDEASVVIFGSTETANSLFREYGCYRNVTVVHPLQIVDTSVFAALEQIEPGTASGDFIDGLVVAMDLMVAEEFMTRKCIKRIQLITDAKSSLGATDEGTNEDQVHTLAAKIQEIGLRVDILLVNPGMDCRHRDSSLSLLELLASKVEGEFRVVGGLHAELNRIKPRVLPSTIYRGEFEVTPVFSIKVFVYKKTSQQRLPSLKLHSERAPKDDLTATHAVRAEREYKLSTDPDVVVAPDQQVKAYRYGPQVVPISAMDRESLQFHADKGVKLIGFTFSSNVPRHYYFADVSLFLPEPGNERAALAMSALARAMKAAGKVAVVRCKFQDRKGLGVTLGLLTPNVIDDPCSSTPDCFYFNALPFAEDIRDFTFTSFKDSSKGLQPTPSQQEAAAELVDEFDLSPPGGMELFAPEETVNPVLQRFYKFAHQRALHPDSELPPLDSSLRAQIQPDPVTLKVANKALSRFKQEFPLEAIGKLTHFWSNKLAESAQEAGDKQEVEGEDEMGSDPAGGEIFSASISDSQAAPDSVGRVDPVRDFHALLARRDGDTWVARGIQGMKRAVESLLGSATSAKSVSSALDCLLVLRQGCVMHKEAKEFNDFLRKLVYKCHNRYLDDFWQRLVAQEISLIDNDEVPDSPVTKEEAKKFLERPKINDGSEREEDTQDILGAVE